MKKVLLIFTFLMSLLSADLYEDGLGDRNWRIYDNTPTGAGFDSFIINDKAYISFYGDSTNNGFIKGGRNSSDGWNNQKDTSISWEMQGFQSYSIYIPIDTTHGVRYLTYTPTDENKGINGQYIRFGLGKSTHLTENWIEFSRNLNNDLTTFEPDNKLIAINGLAILA